MVHDAACLLEAANSRQRTIDDAIGPFRPTGTTAPAPVADGDAEAAAGNADYPFAMISASASGVLSIG